MCGCQFLGLLLEAVAEENELMRGSRLNASDMAADVWTFSEVAVLVQPLLLTYTRYFSSYSSNS